MLELLFKRGERGTAAALAKKARVGFASAYRELREMAKYGVVTTTAEGRSLVYEAAHGNPDADLLRQLVTRTTPRTPTDLEATTVRRRLSALGAPLLTPAEAGPAPDLERTLVDGVRLARKDATVARVMPVVLWTQRKRLDPQRLEEVARRARQKHPLGFLLALTSELRADPALSALARRFRDHRVRGRQDFFELPSSEYGRKLSEMRTPPVADAWGFRMNMELATFKSTFDKFVRVADA